MLFLKTFLFIDLVLLVLAGVLGIFGHVRSTFPEHLGSVLQPVGLVAPRQTGCWLPEAYLILVA